MNSSNIIKEMKEEFLKNKDTILNVIGLEKQKWDYVIEYDKLLDVFDKYESKDAVVNSEFKNTNEIVSGIGKVVIINQTNPYSVLSMILISVRTDNEIIFYLKDKLLGINTVLVEIANKVTGTVKHIDSNNCLHLWSRYSRPSKCSS